MKYILFILWSLCLLPNMVSAQQSILKGKVTNSRLEPLSYVTIQIKGLKIGTRTDDQGMYQFQLEEGEYELIFSLLGYQRQSIKFIHEKNGPPLNIILEESSNDLNEVRIVNFRKDRAEELIRNVIRQKDKIQEAGSSFSAQAYIRATQENETTLSKKKRIKLSDSALKVLEEKTALNMNMSEVLLQVDYTYPNKLKEKRLGVKNRGNSESLFYLTTTDGDFSLYNNLIRIPALSEIPMLSPISYSGLVAYKYKTISIKKKENYNIYTIHFSPGKLGNALVEGEVQIVDTSWSIIRSSYTFPKFHMPEYDYFEVNQENEFVNEKAWMPVRQEFIYFSKAGKNKSTGRTVVIYDQYKIDTQFSRKYFNSEKSATALEAYKRDSNFWDEVRKEPLSEKELKFIQKSDSLYRATHSESYLDSLDRRNNRITLSRVFIWGLNQYNRKKEQNWFFNPLLNIYRPLLPGGARLGYGASYSRIFPSKKSIMVMADINYGIRNKDLMGDFRIVHIYNPFNQGYISINGGRKFDLIFYGDAWVNLLRRSNFYRKDNLQIEHGLELLNGLVLRNSFEFAARNSIDYLSFNYAADTFNSGYVYNTKPVSFDPYNAFYGMIALEYTPFQSYIREPRQKIILGSNYPTAYVRYRKGIPGIFNSKIDFDYLEFGIRQKLKLGLAGISQYHIYSGEFLSQRDLRYIDYKFISRGNPIFFNNPLQSFQALDSTFPIFRRFYEGHYLHRFNGSILNKIPLLKKLQLLEVAGGGILYVRERNLKYVEAFVGIEKTFPLLNQRFKIGIYAVGSLANKYNNPYQFKIGLEQFNKQKNSWY
ncbi:MAG: carboxypeptidase-like regulatory domain-containing protein [Chitinophagaceae bacterium]|nr:carboxypeptidase-like regulatory domain-containing protein [Chitinophagaceae bacterium]